MRHQFILICLYQILILTNKGTKNKIINTYGKEKLRVSVVLAIAADWSCLKPLLIYKGKKNGKKEKSLQNMLKMVT